MLNGRVNRTARLIIDQLRIMELQRTTIDQHGSHHYLEIYDVEPQVLIIKKIKKRKVIYFYYLYVRLELFSMRLNSHSYSHFFFSIDPSPKIFISFSRLPNCFIKIPS